MSDDNVTKLTKLLTDQGKLIEAGWVSYKHLVIPKNAGAVQITESRNAFFAGAQHLFGSMMTVLEPGAEPTEKDLQRMEHIHTELQEYVDAFKKRLS